VVALTTPVRLALGLAYDGAHFHGFAEQPGQATVAGALADAFERIGAGRLRVTCAGRTDSGVHALAQVVHVDCDAAWVAGWSGERDARRERGERSGPTDVPSPAHDPGVASAVELPRLRDALSGLCAASVTVWRVVAAPGGFDARHAATARRYRYDIELGEPVDPLRRGRLWHVGTELDLSLLRLATDPILGEHDFAAFCRRPPDRQDGPIVRRVTQARWTLPEPGVLRFEIEAGAFCHQMVRSIVGSIVAAGSGRTRPSDVLAQLRRGSREGAPSPAPAHGLCLVAVDYPPELGGRWQWPAATSTQLARTVSIA